jgi:site-specific DNA-methyltransferase (adenine-specific)
MGSGTTGIAADREGFSFVGMDLSAEYVTLARRRIAADCPLFNEVQE